MTQTQYLAGVTRDRGLTAQVRDRGEVLGVPIAMLPASLRHPVKDRVLALVPHVAVQGRQDRVEQGLSAEGLSVGARVEANLPCSRMRGQGGKFADKEKRFCKRKPPSMGRASVLGEGRRDMWYRSLLGYKHHWLEAVGEDADTHEVGRGKVKLTPEHTSTSPTTLTQSLSNILQQFI